MSAQLVARVGVLEAALTRAGDRISTGTADQVRATVTGVRGRLALGLDHTVVALVGGTGSGKSSVFNALAGLPFAEVGLRRPTTADVAACAWTHTAGDLLDWLGVDRARRTDRESPLDGESQADLRGLVLLDLPDHDSVEAAHRDVVDRLLPQADLLVWVVDPQKYADDALHSGYLRHLAGHEGAMVLVLNQIDTVPRDAQAALLRDAARLLAEDGLADVPVLGVSARTGEGIPLLRGVLARAVASRGVAEVRAQAELDDAARLLASTVGDASSRAPLPRDATEAELADAAGVDLTLAAVADAAVEGRKAPTVRLGPVQPDRVSAVRERWVAAAQDGLPPSWRSSVDAAVPSGSAVAAALDEALAAVTLPGRSARGPSAARAVAAVLALLALLGLGLTVGVVLAQGWGPQASAVGLVSAAALVFALVLLWWAGRLRRSAARRRAHDLADQARAAVREVVDAFLVRPAANVLEDHEAVRAAAAVDGGVPSPVPPAAVPSTA